MLKRQWICGLFLAVVGITWGLAASYVVAQAPQAGPGRGLAAIDRATKTNRYLFIFFHGQDDPQTRAMGAVFNAAAKAATARADSLVIPINEPSEAGIVARFGVAKAPMPLALVVAPNGALTASFPSNFTKEQLLDAFASPCMEKMLSALQQGKLVLLCVQNGTTRWNVEAMNGVRAFKADQRYAAATEVLLLDPALPAERPSLAKLGVNGPVPDATTLFIAPPGTIIGSFKGATDKNHLIATLTKAISSCASGCQPGGQCCPPAK